MRFLSNSQHTRPLIIKIFLVFALLGKALSISCKQTLNTCSCETEDGKLLDFSPLDAGGGSRFRFSAIDKYFETQRTFEYNPCSPIYCPVIIQLSIPLIK